MEDTRLSLNQVTIGVSDLERAFRFYCALGLHPIVRSEGYARFVVPGNEATLSLHRANSAHSATVVYFEAEDLDRVVGALEGAGFEFVQAPRDQPWQWREAYLTDPDGNRICLYSAGRIRLSPDWRLPESKDRHLLTEADFRRWMDGYRSAWENRDPEAAVALFAADAAYHETPFSEPYVGEEAIREYWQAVPDSQRNVRFEWQFISAFDGVGFCKWRASFIRKSSNISVELDGIIEAEFDAHLRCRRFREWWHAAESLTPA
jgi:catechol 2,3-dioxygenase-like lactoylglutathione lyase family enzyme